MPCTKCEEGKYKWGKTGECEYATKEDCESANHKYNKMKPTPLGKKSYAEYEKELKEFNFSTVYKIDLASIKDVDKFVDALSNETGKVRGIFDDLDNEMFQRRNRREEAEEQLQNAEDYKSNIEGMKNEVELAKGRLEKAQDELKDDQDGFKEENDKYKKLLAKAKEADKKVKGLQKSYISSSKKLDGSISKLKKAYADLQKAGKDLGVGKIPVDMYDIVLDSADEFAGGTLPAGFDD